MQQSSSVARRRLAATCCAGVLTMFSSLVALPARFADQELAQHAPALQDVTDDMLADTITQSVPNDYITAYDIERSIEELVDAETDDGNVIILEADILFEAMQWQLSTQAEDRIEDLIDE